MTGFVYAFVSGDAVKIGWSSNPKTRLSKVRSDTPADVHLAGFIPGPHILRPDLPQLFPAPKKETAA